MRDITLCHPRLQILGAKLIKECSRQGLNIKIGETLRTVEEQDALYAQGRTEPGNIVTNAKGSTYSSYHQWGVAFDIIRNDGQGAYNESGNFFGRVGLIGVALGLEWGGNWKSPVDKPHFQLPDWGSTTSKIKTLYGNPEKFMKTWQEEIDGFLPAADGQRWWYQYADGTYAQNGWYWLTEATTGTEAWYLFDAAGYMLIGYQTASDDRKYCLCPDKGINEGKCMVTDDQGVLKFAEYDHQNKRYKI